MRTNRPYIPLYCPLHFLYGEQTHICILHSLCGIKRKTYKGDHNLLGGEKEKKKKKKPNAVSLSGTHRRLSSRPARKHAAVFCQLFRYAIPNRAPEISFYFFYFSPFLLGLHAESHFKQWAEQLLQKGKKKKEKIKGGGKTGASSARLRVVRVPASFQKTWEDIVLPGPRTPAQKMWALLFWSFTGSWRTKVKISRERGQGALSRVRGLLGCSDTALKRFSSP